MNTNKQTTQLEPKAILSTLWIFVLLNIIFRDIHEIVTPEFIEKTINSVQPTEGLFLAAAIMLEIPIAMVFLSRILKYGLNRWANIITGVLVIVLTVINNTTPDLDDIFFVIVEITGALLIIWYAWKWRQQEDSSQAVV
jgi:hypothetical protein